ncbi:MAG TPA: amidase family protein, partial [Polyangiaceae bacterium]|nr:amidase family protein [Polyangiaceae bacterium]
MALVQHASDIVRLVTEGALSAEQPARDAIERAHSLQRLRSIRSLDPERASQAAGRVTQRLRGGAALPLAGVPVLVKENIAQAGIPA